jgi:glycopeptide antibiotics resistance protein
MGAEVIRILFTPAPLRPKPWLLWGWVGLLILIPTFPWSDFVGHAHWDQVRWIPFEDFSLAPMTIVDVLGNFGWFAIFGYLLHYRKDDRSLASIQPAVVYSLLLTLLIEGFQVFCHNRIPSMTDVVCNVLGAAVGSGIARTHQPIPTRRGHTLVPVDSD